MSFIEKLTQTIEKTNHCSVWDWTLTRRICLKVTTFRKSFCFGQGILSPRPRVWFVVTNLTWLFFEQFGLEGLEALQVICRELIPAEIPVLLDAKRGGDIGSTAEAYARACFDIYGADVVTLSPYLGYDAIKPFTDRADKAVFVLCQTSNPSAKEIQQHGIPALLSMLPNNRSTGGVQLSKWVSWLVPPNLKPSNAYANFARMPGF